MTRRVSVHSDFSYAFFGLVTTRLIAHSGQSECLPNCVGELGMDTR